MNELSEMEGKHRDILKCGKLKITYTRSHLLSFSGLEQCKAFPPDFDISVLCEFDDEQGRLQSNTAVTSCYSHRNNESLQCTRCSSFRKFHSPLGRWENQTCRSTEVCFLSGHTGSDSRKWDTSGVIGPKPQENDQVYNQLRKSENPYRPPTTCKDVNTKSEDSNSVINFGAEEDLLMHMKTSPPLINKRLGVPFISSKESADDLLGEREPSCKVAKSDQGSEVIYSLAQNKSTSVGMRENKSTFPSRTLEEHHNCAIDSKSNCLLAIERPYVPNLDDAMIKASSEEVVQNSMLDLGPNPILGTDVDQNKVLSSSIGSSVDTIANMPTLDTNDSFITSILIASGAYGTVYKDINTSIFSDSRKRDTTRVIGPKPQEHGPVYNQIGKSENPYLPILTHKDGTTKSENPNLVINFGAEEDLFMHTNTLPHHIMLSKEVADNFLGERELSCKVTKADQGSGLIDSLAQNKRTNVSMGGYNSTFPSRTIGGHHNCVGDRKSNCLLAIESPFVSNVDDAIFKAFSEGNSELELCPHPIPRTEVDQNNALSSSIGSSVDTIINMPPSATNDSFLTSLLIASGAYDTNYNDIKTSILAGELEMANSEENPSSSDSLPSTIADNNTDNDDSEAALCLPDEEDLLTFDYLKMQAHDSSITSRDLTGSNCSNLASDKNKNFIQTCMKTMPAVYYHPFPRAPPWKTMPSVFTRLDLSEEQRLLPRQRQASNFQRSCYPAWESERMQAFPHFYC
ncbi:unnamed protein product [Cuscuta campestris]|uniref:Uncharacterized protein n=1 Tax=Cuscuta campestris TaxID=132261 RepID=A0A484L9X4_9ASTE|nr:unnamed protein product [Cuscuta campestris]